MSRRTLSGRLLLVSLSLLACITNRVRATSPAPVGAADSAVAPFLNEQTDIAAALDCTQIDVDQLVAWVTKQLEIAGIDKALADRILQTKATQADVRRWLANFTAAGGRRIYLVTSAQDVMTGDGKSGLLRALSSSLLVIPLEEGVNGEAIARLIDPDYGKSAPDEPGQVEGLARFLPVQIVATIIGKYVVAGSKQTVDAARNMKPTARPEIIRALAAGGNATLRIAATDRAMQKWRNPPKAAPALIQWGVLAVSMPPQEFVYATVEASSPDDAQEILAWYTDLLTSLKDHPKTPPADDLMPPLINALGPGVQASRLTVRLDARVVETTLMPAVLKSAAEQTKHADEEDSVK